MKKLFIIGFAVLLLGVFTAPTMAKVKIGGIVFVDFYYLDRDKRNAADMGKGNGESSYNVTTIQIPNITRLYGRWTNEDNVGGYVELGLGQAYGGPDSTRDDWVKLRHAYGWWDVTPAFQILAGKTTTPFSPLNPSQLVGTRSGTFNIIGAGYGDFYSGRVVQARGTYRFNENVRLALALVNPNGVADEIGEFGPWQYWWWGGGYENSTKLPRIDISVPMSFGAFKFYPSFLYQHRTVRRFSYGEEYQDMQIKDNSLDTYAGSLGVKAGFGPLAISAEINGGKNCGNTEMLLGYSYAAIFSVAGLDESGTRIKDATTYGFWIDVSYKFGPVTPHLIYGEMKSKTSFFGIDLENKTRMYGVSVPIELAKGFQIRPELMWYDEGDVNINYFNRELEKYNPGGYMIAGVQFQITF